MISNDYSTALTTAGHGKGLVALDDFTKNALQSTYPEVVNKLKKDYYQKYGDLLSATTKSAILFGGDKQKITAFAAKDSTVEDPELYKIAALGTLYNSDTTTPDMMQKISAQGFRIDKWVRFGKSRGLYKSVKLPKYLMGYARIKQDSKPSQKLMGFTSFLWNILDTGVLRPPSNFIRVANSYYRTLAKKTDRSPMSTADLRTVIIELDKTNPGLFAGYINYSTASKQYRADMKKKSQMSQAKKEKILNAAKTEYASIEQAFGAFASALDEINSVLPAKTTVTEDTFKKMGEMVDPKPKHLPYTRIGYLSVKTGPTGVNLVQTAKFSSKDNIDSVKAKTTARTLEGGKSGYLMKAGIKTYEDRIAELQDTLAGTASKADYDKAIAELNSLKAQLAKQPQQV